jgi:hypothetical protein
MNEEGHVTEILVEPPAKRAKCDVHSGGRISVEPIPVFLHDVGPGSSSSQPCGSITDAYSSSDPVLKKNATHAPHNSSPPHHRSWSAGSRTRATAVMDLASGPSQVNAVDIDEDECQKIDEEMQKVIEESKRSAETEERRRKLQDLYIQLTRNTSEGIKMLHYLRDNVLLGKAMNYEVTKVMMDLLYMANGGRSDFEKDKSINNNGVGSRSSSTMATQEKAQYGSVWPDLMHDIFKKMKLKDSEVFVDIGSGIGQLVLQATLEHSNIYAVGLEVMDERHVHALYLEHNMELILDYIREWQISTGALSDADPHFQTNPEKRTLMLCGSFANDVETENWKIPLITPKKQDGRNDVVFEDCPGVSKKIFGCTRTKRPQREVKAKLTPPELFQVADAVFLNNANETMAGRNGTKKNSSTLTEDFCKLVRYMKDGSRIVTIDSIKSDFRTNAWDGELASKYIHATEEQVNSSCWIKEEPIEVYGAVSWNNRNGEPNPKKHTFFMYTKVRSTWLCHGCLSQNGVCIFLDNKLIDDATHETNEVCSLKEDIHEGLPEEKKILSRRGRGKL